MTFSDFLPTSWLLLLWIALLRQTRFEAQRWLRALQRGDVRPMYDPRELAGALDFVLLVGRYATWACYGWYGWKAGWQPAVGLAVSSFAVTVPPTVILPLLRLDERLVWIPAAVAILPLCVVSALTVYWL